MNKIIRNLAVQAGILVLLVQWTEAEWEKVNLLDTYSLAANGSYLFSGGYCESLISRSSDNGQSWTVVSQNPRCSEAMSSFTVQAMVVYGESSVFAGISQYGTHGCQNGTVQFSSNNGETWVERDSGLIGMVTAFAIYKSTVFVGSIPNGCPPGFSGGGVFRSTDTGKSWIKTNTGLSDTFVNALAICNENLFASTRDSGIYLSTNNGSSWKAVNEGLPNTTIRALEVCGKTIFAGTNGKGIYSSSNNGQSWSPTNDGLNDTIINTILVYGSSVFSGTAAGGVYLSSDTGVTWSAIDSGLPDSSSITSLVASDTHLYAGISGIWRRPLSEMTAVKQFARESSKCSFFTISKLFRLSQQMAISFSLPKTEWVNICVYDVSGHRVNSLANGHLPAGPHHISWNTRNIATGYYLVRMQAGSTAQAKNVMVLR